MAGGAASTLSKGGMITKDSRRKARSALGGGHDHCVGREENVLVRLAEGEHIGHVELRTPAAQLHARKQWLADQLRSAGRLVLDDGAAKALFERNTSLLPVGVVDVEGEFVRGELVSCVTRSGVEVARGLVNYSSADAKRICRCHTEEIVERLGMIDRPEIVHRDNMVLVDKN